MPAAPVRAADGLELLGPYQGSGFRDERFLVKRRDGQVVHLTRLLYLTLAALDGRTTGEAAAEVSREYGRELNREGLEFLVDTKLGPLGLVATGDDPPLAPRANPLLALRFHGTLLPPRATRLVARLLAPAFHPVVVASVVTALVVVDAWLLRHADLQGAVAQTLVTPGLVAGLILAVVVSSLIHEFGHAAAARYGGAEPGAIGVGIYLIWPAFFTDVTDTYRLDRRGRLRTDLGGIYFTFLLALVAGGVYAATGSAALLLLVLLLHVNALQQLLPIVRLDGYYALGDAVGVPELFGRVRPILASLVPGRAAHPRVAELLPRTRWVVTGWVLLVVPLLLLGTVMLAVQLPTLVRTTVSAVRVQAAGAVESWHNQDVLGVVLAGVSIPILIVPLLGLAALVWALLVRLVRASQNRLHRLGRPRITETGPAVHTVEDDRAADAADGTPGDRFKVTRRGYERVAVDRQLRRLEDELAHSTAEAESSVERIRLLEEEVSTLRMKHTDSKNQLRESQETSYPALKEKTEQLLRTAQQQTSELLSVVRRDAAALTAEAEKRASATRQEADEYAERLLSDAHRNADSVLSEARRSANQMVTEAKTDIEQMRGAAQRQVDELVRQRDRIQRYLGQLHQLLGTLAASDRDLADLLSELPRPDPGPNGHGSPPATGTIQYRGDQARLE